MTLFKRSSLFAFLVLFTASAWGACLQNGYSRELPLGDGAIFCALETQASEASIASVQSRIDHLAELHKDMLPEESDGALGSLHFGAISMFELAQKTPPFQSLNRIDVFTIFNYVEWGYQGVNSVLWKDGATEYPETRQEVRVLSAALNKLPAYQGVVFRGEGRAASEEDMAEAAKDIATLQELVKLQKPYQYKSFMSTTLAKGKDARNAYVRYPVVRYTIKSKSGRYIAPLSSRDWEEEVLFAPGTWFKVIKVRKVSVPKTEDYPLDYRWLVRLEEL